MVFFGAIMHIIGPQDNFGGLDRKMLNGYIICQKKKKMVTVGTQYSIAS